MRKNVKKTLKNRMLTAALLALALAACLLAGCTLPTTSSTTVSLDETGVIQEEIVESQNGRDFTVEELQAYIEEQLAVYNRGKEEPPVKLENCQMENGSVRLMLKYASAADYAAFNNIVCFRGTLQEAEDAGYSMDMPWYEPDGNVGEQKIIMERAKEWKVFIVSEPVNVKVPDKILYASDNVKITGRLTATVETVLNEEEAPAAAASSSEEETEETLSREERLHPLSTVTERFGYIIYK